MKAAEKRVQVLRNYMADKGLDLCVLSSPENMQYFSGFQAITYTRPILFVVTGTETHLIVPALEEDHASLGSTVVEHLHVYYEHPEKAIGNPSAFEILKSLGAKKANPSVGAEFSALSLKNAGMYESWGWKLQDISPQVTVWRAVKDELEKEYIREAGKLCQFAFGVSLDNGRAGITELEFEQFGTTALYNKISGNYPYVFSSPNCFTPSGVERTNMPHVFSGNRKFEKGDMVIHVRKPAINGYHGELERSFFIGKPNPKAEHAFLAMLEAQTAVMDAIRPGVTCSQMDKVGRDVLRRHGYADYAIHRIGHGQGLGRHEEPYLIYNSDLVLQEGMVFTVEPGIYIPGVGGFRHSDTLIITKDGYENTTEFKRELRDLILD
ncbi:M24 family metallopeptidase [Breznakiella homolactica]|uniref:Aminopeptidase P family protein n=1 Tax=Breznakiella homolactica TaxID=2798577 RepID=A0A7T7XPR5_9SPIR|nr:Xaa-Pro peptidase family protein [Breznakiella homolactica]QQO10138.1 Xaa-Pro peptidase family protein [Breznakiella homolactica]